MSEVKFHAITISQNELDIVKNALLFFENEFRLDGVEDGSEEFKQYHKVRSVREFFDGIDKDEK
jgi:hypothetical protein